MKKSLLILVAATMVANRAIFARCALHIGYHCGDTKEFKNAAACLKHMFDVHGGTGHGHFHEHMRQCHKLSIPDADDHVEEHGCLPIE